MLQLQPVTGQDFPPYGEWAKGTAGAIATRSDPLQIVLTTACPHGRGACADFTLKSAALIKTNPTEWSSRARLSPMPAAHARSARARLPVPPSSPLPVSVVSVCNTSGLSQHPLVVATDDEEAKEVVKAVAPTEGVYGKIGASGTGFNTACSAIWDGQADGE